MGSAAPPYPFGNSDDPRKAGVARCLDAADADDDGGMDLADTVRMLMSLLGGAEPPPLSFDSCGTDPTDDDLVCSGFWPCREQ